MAILMHRSSLFLLLVVSATAQEKPNIQKNKVLRTMLPGKTAYQRGI